MDSRSRKRGILPRAVVVAAAAALTLATMAGATTYRGRTLADALQALRSSGLTLLFTDRVVRPEMRVLREPTADDARGILDQILAPHRLAARDGPGGLILIVAADAPSEPPGPSPIDAEAGVLGSRRPGRPFLEEEIVVRSSRMTMLEEERPDAAFALTREDIDHLPHLGDDLFRATSLLPGTSANDVTAQFSVHGGRRDEVKVMLDGQELYEAFHLKDYDNALSIVPGRALEGASLSTGAYGVSYGDRMSGVLDLRTADAEQERRYLLSASVLDLVASSAGGFGGERDGGWLVTGRRGSIDLASEFFGNEDPGFWDVLAKAEVETGVGRLAGRLLVAVDELELTKSEPDSFERLENDYGSRYGWITHQRALSDRLLLETVGSWANIRRNRSGSTDEEKGIFEVRDERDLDAFGLTQSWSLDRAGRHEPSWGWELRRYDAAFDYAKAAEPEFTILAPFSPPRPTEHVFDEDLRGEHAGAWASDRVRVLERLTAELGLRWDRHQATADTLWSPRANLAWRLDERSVVRASWGRFFQSQRPYELQVEDAETALFPAERSEHSVLGYETILDRRVGLQGVRVELFRREIDEPRPRYENLLEPLEFLPEIEPDRVRIAPRSSEAEGVELLLRARGDDRVDGWLAYSYARAEDRIGRDTVPRSLDQPHALTLGIDYRPTPRVSLSAAWRYRSGWPTTPVESIELIDPGEPEEGPEPQLVFGRLNSDRLPVYHRLDLRASRRFDLRRGVLTMFIDVQNLYDRANAAGFDVTLDEDSGAVVRDAESWPGIFPSLGVAWEF